MADDRTGSAEQATRPRRLTFGALSNALVLATSLLVAATVLWYGFARPAGIVNDLPPRTAARPAERVSGEVALPEPTLQIANEPTTIQPSAEATAFSPPETAAQPATPTDLPDTAVIVSPLSAEELNASFYDAPLFAATSPWNRPAEGEADRRSDQMIDNLAATMEGRGFSINLDRYAIPIFYADAATPRITVAPSTTWWPGLDGPMPDGARPDPGDDRHFVVWDLSAGRLYEFWGAVRASANRWCGGYGVTFDAAGPGFQSGEWHGSARAYGGSLAAGAIRYAEMARGRIDHALAMAYPAARGDAFAGSHEPGDLFGIASHSGNDLRPAVTTESNIPLGARLRLKRSVNVAQRCGDNPACQTIGQALQTYGMFVVDAAGAPVFYAENLAGRSASWDGVLNGKDARAFAAQDFEVLALPTLTMPPEPSGGAPESDPPPWCGEPPSG